MKYRSSLFYHKVTADDHANNLFKEVPVGKDAKTTIIPLPHSPSGQRHFPTGSAVSNTL